jgi:hypothetical protein
MIDGVWSKPIKNWDGAPICREHVSQCIARANGQTVIVPTIDFSSQSPSLH